MFQTMLDMFNPFKLMMRFQRDTLLFFRTILDMEISMLNTFLGEEKGKEEKKGKAKKVEIK